MEGRNGGETASEGICKEERKKTGKRGEDKKQKKGEKENQIIKENQIKKRDND